MVDVDLERFNHIRLRAVPEGGRVSEEIERCERIKNKASRVETELGLLSLQFSFG